MKNYTKAGNKLTDKFDDTKSEHHQNVLIDDYIALLCDTIEDENGNKTTRSMHMLHASIDNDTSLLENVIDELQEGSSKKVLKSYDAYTLRQQSRAKDEFITGKYGIGPYALNNNSQVLTTLYEIEFADDKDSIMSRLNLTSLHRQTDRDGESIMSWLSGLINIHVDVAKDPKHNKLNINGYTHNLVNLLVRTGLGKTTFYFTTQPIMRELATVVNNASGKYMLEKGVSQNKLKKNAEQQYIMNIAKANGITGRAFGSVIRNWEKRMHDKQIGINSAIDWLLSTEGSEVLKDIAKNGYSMDSNKEYAVDCLWGGKSNKTMLSVFDIQMLMYRAFKQFTPYAEALSELVKYSKIDTRKQGKNLIEQKQYMQGYSAMFDKDSTDKNRQLFKTDGLDRLRDGSYIGQMTEDSIGVFTRIMGSQVIQGTDRFIGRGGLVDGILNAVGRFGTTDAQLLNSVSGAILAKKKSTFFNEYARRNNINIKGLVDGNNTIFNRLCKIKSEIICTERYKSLRDLNGNIKNYMLQSLVAGYTHDFKLPDNAPYGSMQDDYNSVKFINTLSFIDDEAIDQDEFIQAWEDLLNDTRFPELQEFARDLILYAFVTAADNGGRNDLMKFVPNSWKIQSGYVDEMVRLLDRFNDKQVNLDSTLSREDIEDIILNNWWDDNYVHTIEPREVREFFSKVKQTNGSVKSTGYPTIIGLPSDTYTDSDYIKIVRPNIADNESQRKYIIYKRVGTGKHTETIDKLVDGKVTPVTNSYTYPIYVAVEPRGNKFNDRQFIYSYGRNESTRENLTNLCLDALAFQLLVERGIKVQNTEQAFNELSKIFHEVTPAVAEAIKGVYGSMIQDVVEEYNKIAYAVEDSVNGWREERLAWNKQNQSSILLSQIYERHTAENNSDVLYIFTDNTDRDSGSGVISDDSWYAKEYGKGLHYPTKTSAVVRGLDNARPISTQRYYHEGAKGETGRWNDSDFEEFKKVIDKEFNDIFEAWNSGKYKHIFIPFVSNSDGSYGNGILNGKISQLTKERTPKLFDYLQDKLMELNEMLQGVNNSIDELPFENQKQSQSIPNTAEEAEEKGKRIYQAPEMDINDIKPEEELMSQIDEKKEEFFSVNDLLTPLLSYDAVKLLNDSNDILGDLMRLFNEEDYLVHNIQTPVEQSKKGKLFDHFKNRWVVFSINEERMFPTDEVPKQMTGVDYARLVLPKWLSEKGLPNTFIQITDGGLVIISNSYLNKRREHNYVKKFKKLGALLMEKCLGKKE